MSRFDTADCHDVQTLVRNDLFRDYSFLRPTSVALETWTYLSLSVLK